MSLTLTRDGVWKVRRGSEQEYLYQVERAKSGRARCRRCSEFIPKGELRWAIPIRHQAGEFGYISAWQHIACTRVELVEPEQIEAKVHGLAALSKEEVRCVMAEVTSKDKPPHLQELNPDDLVKRGRIEAMAAPPAMLQHLLPFQEEGLRWMVDQERPESLSPTDNAVRDAGVDDDAPSLNRLKRIRTVPCRGGILADEMGMGKTIQMISLILANRGGPTLVVCPVSSMSQWLEEIVTHVKVGELSVMQITKVDAGAVTRDALRSADVVLTTYPILERSWRMLVDEGKIPCAYCGVKFLPRKLRVHNKYFCGPNARRTQKQSKREKRSNKVQSAATIQKGLRTLRVVDDAAAPDAKVEHNSQRRDSGSNGAVQTTSKNAPMRGKNTKGTKPPNPVAAARRPRKEETTSSEDSGVISSSSEDTRTRKKKPAAKTKAAASTKPPAKGKASKAPPKASSGKARPSQAKEPTRRRGAKAGAASSGSSAERDDEPIALPTTARVLGPMGMYRELMSAAGRRARSRWERARLSETESDASDTEAVSSTSSSSSELDSDASSEPTTDSSDEERVASGGPRLCEACGFQIAQYKFCPKTGEAHADALIRPLPADDEDTGADAVDLAKSLLHSVTWYRVVLDEAHRIKGRTTSTARSAFALKAENKWCLTGTPIQNRVGDLYSLLRFLRLTPYARYYCQTANCPCTTLSHPFSGASLNACVYCGHGPLQHFSYFNRHIMNPIVRYGYVGDGRKAMMLLVGDVLNRVMLRRTKAERAEDIRLPPCDVKVVYVELSDAERDFYTALYMKSAAQFDTFVHRGTLLHNYAHIFQLLSRLRQALDHPYLVLFSNAAYAAAVKNTAVLDSNGTVPPVKRRGKSRAAAASPSPLKAEESEVDPAIAAAATLGVSLRDLPAASADPQCDVCHLCQESTCARTKFIVEPCKHGFHRLCLAEYVDMLPEAKHEPDCAGEAKKKKKAAGASSAAGPTCPRCFTPMAIDLRRLHHVIDDEAASDASDAAAEEDISPVKVQPLDKGRAKKHPRAEQPPPRAPLLVPVRPDDDNDDVFTDVSNKAMQHKEEEEASRVDNDGGMTSSATQQKKNNNNYYRASSVMNRIDTSRFVSGTKLDAIVNHVADTVPCDEKVIVFSQFGAMLDLVEHALERRAVRTVKLMGHMPQSQRQAMLSAFRHEAAVKCILISLKAGGEGLNLQCANHVVLIDPWWNPAVDMQAIQRAHRIGQRRVVHAVRFVTKDSVEERMLTLQEKKLLVFHGTVDGSADSLQRLTEEDLQFLFTR